jgi:hypothetical protein
VLHTLAVGGAGVALAGDFAAYAMQAARTAGTPALARLNRFPRMVQEFFVERENEAHQQRLKRFAALSTRADAEAYSGPFERKYANPSDPLQKGHRSILA